MKAIVVVVLATAILFGGLTHAQELEQRYPDDVKELIEILKKADGVYTWPGIRQKLDWVRDSDIPYLVGLLESKEECAHVVLAISSRMPMLKSTVGHQAAYLIEGYWKRFYPTSLSSDAYKADSEQIRSWYQQWSRLSEVEQRLAPNRDSAVAPSLRIHPQLNAQETAADAQPGLSQ